MNLKRIGAGSISITGGGIWEGICVTGSHSYCCGRILPLPFTGEEWQILYDYGKWTVFLICVVPTRSAIRPAKYRKVWN